MRISDLPPDVLQFIAEKIDSVPHIEALLLLYGQPDQRWSIELMAARLYVTRTAAQVILNDLERARLVHATGNSVYAYEGTWDASGELMARVAETYRRSLAAVAAFIHGRASRSVQEFARAFDLKRDQ